MNTQKALVSVHPRIETTIPVRDIYDGYGIGDDAIEAVKKLTNEELGRLVRESLNSQPALAYPLDFTELVEILG